MAPDFSSPATARTGLVWAQVLTIFQRELKGALRDKTIVFNSIVIPVFLYPFLLWAAFSGIMLVMGQTEGTLSRIAVSNWPHDHPQLRREFKKATNLALQADVGSEQSWAQQIRDGKVDAVLAFELKPAGTITNFTVKITYDQSRETSRIAKERAEVVIEDYRAEWLEREGRRLGVGARTWEGFVLQRQNVASGRQMGTFVLGLLLPVIFVVMVAVGCFYPAVDTLAGERERGTWETLSTSAASRLSIVAGKYLFVTTMGGVAGALNVAAVLLTAKPIFAPVMARAGETLNFGFPLHVVPVLALTAVLLAGFIAAGMMIFASFARTFKEGQSMITPFYLLIMLPIVFLQVPGLKLTVATACVPVVNLTLMVREAVSGTLHLLPVLVAVAVSLAVIALALRLATYILAFEDIAAGTFNGSFARFARQRLLPGGQKRSLQP